MILVTGSSGLVGSELISQLLAQGNKVKAIYKLFANEKGEVETENGYVKDFSQKLEDYKQ